VRKKRNTIKNARLVLAFANVSQSWHERTFLNVGGGGATGPLLRDGGVDKLHEDPTVGPRPKVWTRVQKWKKQCQRWRAEEA